MAFTVFIEGTERTDLTFLPDTGGNIRYSLTTRAIGQASVTLFAVDDGAGAYRPSDGDTIVVKIGGVDLLAGEILDWDEDPFTDGETGWDVGVLLRLTVADQYRLLDYALYTKTYAIGTTVKGILQDLVANKLGPNYSITLAAGQADGPALTSPLVFTDAFCLAVVAQVQTLTGWVLRLTPALVLSMIEPGVVSSSITLQDSDTDIIGRVTVRRARSANYGNTVFYQYGPTGPLNITITRATDGVTSSWVLPVTGTPTYNIVYVSVLGGYRTIGPGAQYEWDVATKTLSVGTDAVPGVGTISLELTVQFPQTVSDFDAAALAADGYPKERKYTEADKTDPDAALVKLAALLRRAIAAGAQVVTVTHRRGIAYPGETVTLSFAEHAVSGLHMIVSVEVTDDVDGEPVYTFACVSGNEMPDTWLDYFRGGGSGSSGAIAVGGSFSSPPTTAGTGGYFLGSAGVEYVRSPTPTWVPGSGGSTTLGTNPFRIRIDTVARGSESATIRSCLRAAAAGVTVQARLYNVTDAAPCPGVSGIITTSGYTSFVVTLTAGAKDYELQLLPGTANEDVSHVSYLE